MRFSFHRGRGTAADPEGCATGSERCVRGPNGFCFAALHGGEVYMALSCICTGNGD